MTNFEVMDFWVPGVPVGKQRPRVTAHGTFTPVRTKDYERLIGRCYCAKADVRREEYVCPVKMMITVYVAPPKSMTKSMRERALRNDFAPTKKPDIDNIAKSVLDALNGLAYADDKQVCDLCVRKLYGDEHGIRVTLWWWKGADKTVCGTK